MISRIEVITNTVPGRLFVYTIDKIFTDQELKKIAAALTNPVSQTAFVNRSHIPKKFSFAIEIGYLPGVTDNSAATAKELIEDLLKKKFTERENVYTSQITFLDRNLTDTEVKKIAESLYNPVIQRAKIKSRRQFMADGGMGKEIPLVKLNQPAAAMDIDLNISDEELVNIGKKGIANPDGTRRGPLALDLSFMKAIRQHFQKLGRNPTDIELESIAQTWSEHCKHTIFADPIDELKKGLFKSFIKAATDKINSPMCVSVFTDNSGAIEFDQGYLITHKVETHNSPSALDPFGGAVTGIVGVNRDTIGFGLGAKPVANYYGFCLADPKDTTPIYKGKEFTQKMLAPRRIMDGVIAGVNNGGNCSGIPTPQGFLVFDKRYKGKPLVFVGTVGLIPKEENGKKLFIKKAQPGDYVVMVGGRVGLDGVHGATFSSEAMDSGSPATAVQIGDPITQKKLSDAIVKEARDLGLYHSITDNGAGGLSCSVAEMAKESGGCTIDLENVPLKYPGLSPWQIWISESQERMTLAVPKNKWKQFCQLMCRRGVEAFVIGEFTGGNRCIVKYKNKSIMDVDMRFLHDGLPVRPMTTDYHPSATKKPVSPKISKPAILKQLQDLNIAGYEFLSMQYDHEVQASSVIKPLQGRGRVNGDATVVRPLPASRKGIVLSQGIWPELSDNDAYYMAAWAIDMAIRNTVVAGADLRKLALLDNFCWCSPEEPYRLGQLKKAAQACYDYAIAYSTPFISGKDSMYNDFKGYDNKGNPIKISIPPTLLISTIGVIDDITKAVSIDLKFPGDLIYLLGDDNSKINAAKNKKLYEAYHRCTEKGLIASAISVGRGGAAITLCKAAIAGSLGMEVDIKTEGKIVISINPQNKKEFEKMMKGNMIKKIGVVTDKNYLSLNKIKIKLDAAEKAYKSTFKNF